MYPCAKEDPQDSWEIYVNRNTASIDQKKKLQNERRLLDSLKFYWQEWAKSPENWELSGENWEPQRFLPRLWNLKKSAQMDFKTSLN